ncbi:MAG: alpha-ribazole phosphatase family protein [Pseudomonadota bacterium]
MAVTFVRHTTPAIAPDVCYGRSDLDLAASFPEEFDAVAAAMPDADRIVSSPLRRCRRLAEHLSGLTGRPLAFDQRLIEMDFGAWERRPWSDIPQAELDAWVNDFLNARPHGGESVAALRARSLAAVADVKAQGGRTLIVTHSGVIKCVFAKGDAADDFKTNVPFGGVIALSTHSSGDAP